MIDDIRRTSPIKKSTELLLFDEYQTASISRKAEIRKIIINSNMRFVLNVALKYKNVKGVNLSELVSEGKLGLFRAFEKYDYTTRLRFISYAVWWIRSSIVKYMEELDLIRLPAHQKHKLNKELKKKDASKFDSDTYYLHELVNMKISLDNTIKDNLPVSDVIQDDRVEGADKVYFNSNMRTRLMEFISGVLKSEEMVVISSLYGLKNDSPLPLRDVKDIIGKSHERVRQIRDNALRTLRKYRGIEEFKRIFQISNAD